MAGALDLQSRLAIAGRPVLVHHRARPPDPQAVTPVAVGVVPERRIPAAHERHAVSPIVLDAQLCHPIAVATHDRPVPSIAPGDAPFYRITLASEVDAVASRALDVRLLDEVAVTAKP